jgi:hypothetical protein
MADFFDPPPEQLEVVLVDERTIRRAQRQILSCEACSPDAEIPFDWMLDRLTGRLGSNTDYVLEVPAKCPRCASPVTEKTLVEPDPALDR